MIAKFAKLRPKPKCGKTPPGVSPWCNCSEILSRRSGFICLTGAKPCPHCGLRVPVRYQREIIVRKSREEVANN